MTKFADVDSGFAGVTAGRLREAHQRDPARLARPAGGRGVRPAVRAVGGSGAASRPYPPGRVSPPATWLSFPRVIDVPFEICVAALESWQRTGQDGVLRIGRSLLRWPAEHGRGRGTCRIEVRLARGPLRPPLRMRLDIHRWSASSARTALELIPCQRVRPTAAYFRSGHLLLDSLTHALRQHSRPSVVAAPTARSPAPGRPGGGPGRNALGPQSRQ